MVRMGDKFGVLGRICKTAALGSIVVATTAAQSATSENPLQATAHRNDIRIVVVHSDDQVGISGLTQTQSCLRTNTMISEQKPIDSLRSVFLIMKYDGDGKILGVHYGPKNLCEFLQNSPSKLSS